MNPDEPRYDGPHAQLTFAVLGWAMDVLNGLGAGLHEKPYENALVVEFGLRGIAVEPQARFPVSYKGAVAGEYIPDLIAGASVIVDTKVIERITDLERGQMLNGKTFPAACGGVSVRVLGRRPASPAKAGRCQPRVEAPGRSVGGRTAFNCLRLTGLRVGLIINFKRTKLE